VLAYEGKEISFFRFNLFCFCNPAQAPKEFLWKIGAGSPQAAVAVKPVRAVRQRSTRPRAG